MMIGLNWFMTVVHFVCWATQISGSIVLAVGLARTCDWLEKSLKGTDDEMSYVHFVVITVLHSIALCLN